MRSHPTALGLLVAACAGLSGACSAGDVTVASDTPETLGRPCRENLGCSTREFCAKDSCGAPEGQCLLRPPHCDGQAVTACGCDGVNYWNDCLREQAGVAASTTGECTAPVAVPCGGHKGTACPTAGALCAKLSQSAAGACDPALPGVCWALPPVCPTDDGGAVWQSCGPKPPLCVDVCTAIRNEAAFRPVNGRPCP